MQVHLVDGTYELFRYHFSPANKDPERGATGAWASCLMLLEQGATHVGVPPTTSSSRSATTCGPATRRRPGCPVSCWRSSPCRGRAAGRRVHGVADGRGRGRRRHGGRGAPWPPPTTGSTGSIICTPDKDLGQCVSTARSWQWDRRQDKWFDAAGVRERLGVPPESVPDLLAARRRQRRRLPRPARAGAPSPAAAVLARWGHLEAIPADPIDWDANVRGASKLNLTLREQSGWRLLFRRIATVERDCDVGAVDEWEWTRPDGGASPPWSHGARRRSPRRAGGDAGGARERGLAGRPRPGTRPR